MELVKRLSEAYGPAGAEEQIHTILQQELSIQKFQVQTDTLGNFLVTKPGTDPGAGTVVIIASMDEIGLMVIDIDEKGWLRVGPVGVSKPAQWIGQRVRFANQTVGIVGAEVVNNENDLMFSHLYIDLGVHGVGNAVAEGTVENPVQIGDVAVFHVPFLAIGNDIWIGKALDNRAACAAIVQTLKSLPTTKHTICAIFSAQHEVGTRGGRPAVYSLTPKFAVALGTVPAGDMPKAKRSSVAIGGGPAILVMEKNIIVFKRLRTYIENLANSHSLPYQWAISPERLSDAGVLAVSKTGILTAGISIPIRYPDTICELVYRSDYEQTVQLLVHLLSVDLTEMDCQVS